MAQQQRVLMYRVRMNNLISTFDQRMLKNVLSIACLSCEKSVSTNVIVWMTMIKRHTHVRMFLEISNWQSCVVDATNKT
jgi:hypothetical protein